MSNPVGNVSTTEKAMGLANSVSSIITATSSGHVLVIFSGMVGNSAAAGDGVTITGRYGTGTPPVNGATTGLGTQWGLPQSFVASTTAGRQGFCMQYIVGVTVGVATWFDLSIIAVGGGGATIYDVSFSAVEL
jgi:hypothetical protein